MLIVLFLVSHFNFLFVPCGGLSVLLHVKFTLSYRIIWQFAHQSGHSSAAGRAQDRESSPVKDKRSTTVPRNQPIIPNMLHFRLFFLHSYFPPLHTLPLFSPISSSTLPSHSTLHIPSPRSWTLQTEYAQHHKNTANVYYFMPPPVLTGYAWCSQPVCPSVGLSVRYRIVNAIFWKWMNWF